MYADDSTIYTSADSLGKLEQVSNEELKLTEEWLKATTFVLNAEKTKCVVFGCNFF